LASVQRVQIVGDLTKSGRSLVTKKAKGFRRSQKQWEESTAEHIGKFIDKITINDIMKGSAFLGGAYLVHEFITNPYAPLVSPILLVLDRKKGSTQSIAVSCFVSWVMTEHGISLLGLLI